jgi:hypothetical protein
MTDTTEIERSQAMRALDGWLALERLRRHARTLSGLQRNAFTNADLAMPSERYLLELDCALKTVQDEIAAVPFSTFDKAMSGLSIDELEENAKTCLRWAISIGDSNPNDVWEVRLLSDTARKCRVLAYRLDEVGE